MTTTPDETDSSAIVHSADDPNNTSSKLGYLRLGAYQSAEDGYIDTSIDAGTGIYMMTDAQYTTDIEGAVYIEAGNSMTIVGDSTIAITDAGQTSLRAMTVGIAANRDPSSGNNNINLDSSGSMTLEADKGIDITCERLVYVVNQDLKISSTSKGVSYYKTQTSFTLGGKTGVYVMNNTDISGMRWEPRIFDHKVAFIDNSSVVVKGSGQIYKNENHGFRAFLVGLFCNIAAAESETTAVDNDNTGVDLEQSSLDSSQSGANSENNLVAGNSSSLSSN